MAAALRYEDRVIQEESPQKREELTEAAVKVAGALCQLRYLCRALAAAPVMVPSGQERPRTRVRYVTHPQRSYQDVQNELAVELASLPRFTVLCDIEGEQHRVALNRPAEGDLAEARIARIRQNSRARFGRPPDTTAPLVAPGVDDSAPQRRLRRHLDEDED